MAACGHQGTRGAERGVASVRKPGKRERGKEKEVESPIKVGLGHRKASGASVLLPGEAILGDRRTGLDEKRRDSDEDTWNENQPDVCDLCGARCGARVQPREQQPDEDPAPAERRPVPDHEPERRRGGGGRWCRLRRPGGHRHGRV